MKQITALSLALAILILSSCKKDNVPELVPGPGPATVIPPDTLGIGWKKIPFGNDMLNDIFFIGNTGFCISSKNIYKTIDAGITWTGTTFWPSDLFNLGMGSDTNAIFISSKNEIIFTHNGGISFENISSPDSFVTDVFFVNPSTAYIAGKSIWKTTNGGNTWIKLYEFITADGYKSLYFLNDQIGWVIRKEGLYKTINGGVDWQLINTGLSISSNYGSVFFPDASHGFFSSQLYVASTNNSGSSWNKTYTGISSYHDIHFISADTGYITDQLYILKTIDGGITWNKEVAVHGEFIVELHFMDADHGWACGSNGILLKYEK